MAIFGLLGVLFCLLFGYDQAGASTVCDLHMVKRLAAKTRFVDAKEIAKTSAQQLQADAKMYIDIRDQLESDPDLLRNVNHYIDLLERVLEQKRAGKPAPPDVAPTISLSVGNETSRELFPKMASVALAHTPNPVVRYFPIARQDIALATGTDRTGIKSEETWDMWGLEATLKQLGLNLDDGFYALPVDEMRDCGVDQHGAGCPYEMIDEFMRGERAFAIYDGDQLTTDGPDFYLFANPKEKAKALKAIILPRP